jgi:hypothetical protein
MKWLRFGLLAVLLVAGGFALAIIASAPAGAVETKEPPVGPLPEETTSKDFLLLEDVSTFDLRKWRPLHWWNRWRRWSPVEYTDTLRIRRVGLASRYVAHYGTTGLAIDLDCIGMPCDVRKKPDSDPKVHQTEYSVTIYLDSVPVGKEARVVVRGTYWNGARDTERSDAGTYTSDDIREMTNLTLRVFLPPDKPARAVRMYWTPSEREGTGASDPYPHVDELRMSPDHRRLDWVVSDRRPDLHYRLVWDW